MSCQYTVENTTVKISDTFDQLESKETSYIYLVHTQHNGNNVFHYPIADDDAKKRIRGVLMNIYYKINKLRLNNIKTVYLVCQHGQSRSPSVFVFYWLCTSNTSLKSILSVADNKGLIKYGFWTTLLITEAIRNVLQVQGDILVKIVYLILSYLDK